MSTPYYRVLLRGELARRLGTNPRYSLRAFAHSLEINPGSLSRLLSGKRGLSLASGERICDRLALGPKGRGAFLQSLVDERARRGLSAETALETMPEAEEIDLDRFHIIAQLYHYALLELTFVEGFSSDPRWIGKALGISEKEARLAVQRLARLGLVEKKQGRLRKTLANLTTKDKHVTTPALREHQKQVLAGAIDALESEQIEQRDMTSMTMAIDPAKLPAAKKMIRDFTESLCAYLENGKRKRVYQLGIGLYPLQKDLAD